MPGIVAHRASALNWPIGAAALLVVSSLVLVALATIDKAISPLPSSSSAVATRELRFEDRADGGIDVIDPRTSAVVDVLEPGSHGFVRGVLRALARGRLVHNIGSGPNFLIIRNADRSMWIEDTATNQRIALNAFGQTNAGAFQRLLPSHEARQ